MPKGKGNGPGRPKWKIIGPVKPDPRLDRPDPSKPKCNQLYQDRYFKWHRCGKRGYHWKHGPGKG